MRVQTARRWEQEQRAITEGGRDHAWGNTPFRKEVQAEDLRSSSSVVGGDGHGTGGHDGFGRPDTGMTLLADTVG
ncbi:MAG: hypothetical protein HYZ81_10985 [Nitrospinae bacterium]|nr:hypothetical protein [Nitrospinota bacterium]